MVKVTHLQGASTKTVKQRDVDGNDSEDDSSGVALHRAVGNK